VIASTKRQVCLRETDVERGLYSSVLRYGTEVDETAELLEWVCLWVEYAAEGVLLIALGLSNKSS
jgi:hypothetical protein